MASTPGAARPRQVHRGDAALGDAGADDVAVGRVGRDVVALVGVGRGAGGLERAVDAVGRLADDLELVDRVGGGGGVEFHGQLLACSSTAASVRSASGSLKALSWVGWAPASSRAVTALRLAASRLGGFDAPGLVRHAAERDAAGAVALHDGGHRDQREGIGGAVAHLAVDVRAAHRARQRHGGDQLAALQVGLDVRRVAGQAVEVGDRDHARAAVGPHGFHRGVEHAHGHGHVARVRGDAGLAGADDRVLAADAADGAAAAAGLALVAGLVGVVEVGAARALQQVAGGGRLVAQLARGAGQQRARQHAVVAPHALVGGQVGVAHQRADAQAAFGVGSILSSARPLTSTRCGRRLDLQLHQVQQVGAAGDELGAGLRATAAAASAGELRAFVGEGFHVLAPPRLR
jgi:hypothetical protein